MLFGHVQVKADLLSEIATAPVDYFAVDDYSQISAALVRLTQATCIAATITLAPTTTFTPMPLPTGN